MANITMTMTNVGLNLYRDSAKGASDPKIYYVAVGTSSTTPNANDTTLGSEAFRKAVTSYSNGLTGQLIVNAYISDTEAVGVDIDEIGVFAGSTASALANTGVLLARGIYNLGHAKLNTESIVLQLNLQFSVA